MGLLVPARHHGPEILDDPATPWALRERSHRDIARANRWLGGDRALQAGVREAIDALGCDRATLLDVGAGTGRLSSIARAVAHRRGVSLTCITLDLAPPLAASAVANGHLGVCGDALALPFPTGSIDLVACSLLAHHFAADPLRTLLRELDRVARHRVIVVDLRRSWLAAAGIWLASFPLGFHPISRHDGRVSVLRAFTPAELRRHITDATGAHATVTKRAGYRLLATWCPAATVHTPATIT